MQDNQELSRATLFAPLKANRVFLYWFIPLVFVCTFVLTYSVPAYYVCSTSLSTEEMSAIAESRSITLNHPENYDLGLAPLRYSIVPDDYDELVASTAFLCKVLAAKVKTKDNSFEGTYYEYLIKHHRNTWAGSCKQWLKGSNTANVEGELPELDPFQPKRHAAIAISRAKKSISCSINHQTKLVTITVSEQDPMVAALVAQATSDELNRFTTDYYTDKVKQTYQLLQTQIELMRAQYEEAARAGDNARASMLHDACISFERQAIMQNALAHNYKMFTTLKNVTVPTQKAGPKHLVTAIAVTLVALVLALLVIYRKELISIL